LSFGKLPEHDDVEHRHKVLVNCASTPAGYRVYFIQRGEQLVLLLFPCLRRFLRFRLILNCEAASSGRMYLCLICNSWPQKTLTGCSEQV
jgi:hypothetical protein